MYSLIFYVLKSTNLKKCMHTYLMGSKWLKNIQKASDIVSIVSFSLTSRDALISFMSDSLNLDWILSGSPGISNSLSNRMPRQ